MPAAVASPTRPVLVLDTNIVLDWLVFRDPSCGLVADAVMTGRARWIASLSMREELEHVLTRIKLDGWNPDVAFALESWDRWAQPVEIGSLPQGQTLHCTDPDDQKFIDLALHAAADALISRDRALLRLARRARPFGVHVVTAAVWAQRCAFPVNPEPAGLR